MGFFKKKELSEEEKVKRQAEQEEREKIRREKADQRAAENAVRKQERAAKKAEKEAAEKAEMERFFGTNPDFETQMIKIGNSTALERIKKMISDSEEVVATVEAEYDMPGGKEVKGLLVATNQKLLFSSDNITKEFTEVMDYKSMSSIKMMNDGFTKKELHVVSGREKRVFDDIRNNHHLDRLLDGVRKQISVAHAGTSNQPQSNVVEQKDRVQQLKELAELKNTGILTEEEFQTEKQKILSS